MTSSIFAAVEMAPRDPILGLNEAFNADPQHQGQPLASASISTTTARFPPGRRQGRRGSPPQGRRPPRLPAHRRPGRLQHGRAKPAFGKDSSLLANGQVVTAGPGRHRCPQDRRRLPEAPQPGRQGLHQRSLLGNHRACSSPPVSWSRTTLLRCRHPRRQFRRHESLPGRPARRFHRRPARLLPHPPAPTSPTPSGPKWSPSARSAAWCPSSTWPTRGFADGIDADAVAVRLLRLRPAVLRLQFVFQELLALRRARRALSIVTASKDEAARVMSQLKRVIRTNYSNPPTRRRPGGRRTRLAGTAPDGKPNWPACATASAPCAPAWSTPSRPRASPRTLLRRHAARHVLLHRPHRRPGGAHEGRVRHLRGIHRPHLSGRAQQQEPGLRRPGHRHGHQGLKRPLSKPGGLRFAFFFCLPRGLPADGQSGRHGDQRDTARLRVPGLSGLSLIVATPRRALRFAPARVTNPVSRQLPSRP